MPKANKSKSGRAATGKASESTGGAGTVLKWIGGGTAVLSLIFGLRQLSVLISDARDRQRQATELIAAGRLQQAARDLGFPSAGDWSRPWVAN